MIPHARPAGVVAAHAGRGLVVVSWPCPTHGRRLLILDPAGRPVAVGWIATPGRPNLARPPAGAPQAPAWALQAARDA